MHSQSKLDPHHMQLTEDNRVHGKKVPTLCISAPDDIHQCDRETLWTFQAKHRGPPSISVDSKLCTDEDFLVPKKAFLVKGALSPGNEFSAHTFPGRNLTMSDPRSGNGKRYKLDIPEILPNINARFNTNKMVIPSINGKGLQPQASFSSIDYQSDDEEEHSTRIYLDHSLPTTFSQTDYGLSSIVIRSLQAEKEQLLAENASSSDETHLESIAYSSTDTVHNNDKKFTKKGHPETFIEVPTATTESNFRPSLEITSGISIPDGKHKRNKELEKNARLIVRKRHTRTNRKSKRHSRDDPVMFAYKKLGSSSSTLNSETKMGDSMGEEDTAKIHGLRDLLENYVIQSPYNGNRSSEVFRVARNKFNDMVNTKELLDESVYDDFARFIEKPTAQRRESSLLSMAQRISKTDESRNGKSNSTEGLLSCRSYREQRECGSEDIVKTKIKWKLF